MARLNRGGGDNRLPSYPSETSSPVTSTGRPDVTSELLTYLDATFPNALPPEGSPYSALERAWGRREVIDHLRQIKEQNEQDNHVLRLQQARTGADTGPAAAASG